MDILLKKHCGVKKRCQLLRCNRVSRGPAFVLKDLVRFYPIEGVVLAVKFRHDTQLDERYAIKTSAGLAHVTDWGVHARCLLP